MTGNKGFTLVEMLVVVSIFAVVIGTAIGVYTSVLRLQKYNLNHHQLLNQTSYFVDYMSRAIRMAKKDSIGCIDGSNYQEGVSSIKFATYHDECWEFYLSGNQLMVNQDGNVYDLTSDDVIINSFTATVSGDGVDSEQPKVTLNFDVVGNLTIGSSPRTSIQTSISQRNLDL